jgi:hypothetical protein
MATDRCEDVLTAVRDGKVRRVVDQSSKRVGACFRGEFHLRQEKRPEMQALKLPQSASCGNSGIEKIDIGVEWMP